MPSSSVGRAGTAAARAGEPGRRRRQRERHELAADERRRCAGRRSATRRAARTRAARTSAAAGTVGPPSASTPQYSTHHSSTASPAISTRFAKIAAVAFAFSYASGHENATRASPAQPAWCASSALYVSVAGAPRTPVTRTRSSPEVLERRADVKSATTSGARYAAGSCTSYSSWWRTVSKSTRPPDAAGFVITAVPSASTSAIG